MQATGSAVPCGHMSTVLPKPSHHELALCWTVHHCFHVSLSLKGKCHQRCVKGSILMEDAW